MSQKFKTVVTLSPARLNKNWDPRCASRTYDKVILKFSFLSHSNSGLLKRYGEKRTDAVFSILAYCVMLCSPNL